MVRVKFSTKAPPHWKTHTSDTRQRQETKKGGQSKVDNDDESWLLLPEPASDAVMPEVDEPTKVDIPSPLPGTRLHAAMDLIPIGDIVSEMYNLGCPPTNEEVVSNAKIFIQAAANLDATGKVKDAAEVILVDLAFTIKGRDTGAFPVGQQYEYLEKQVIFLGTLIEHMGHSSKTVTCAAKAATTKPARKRVSQLQLNIPKTDRVLRSRAARSN
ncbi:hypothetical protein B0T13DRAFT_512014 [Neurospora crassa]|nr:hypothetical protein B0T13DRAFT_512014 [Neurospora crassa]